MINPLTRSRLSQVQMVQSLEKFEQTKLPKFWGYKSKDSITANEFVKRIDNMTKANNWADNIALSNFTMALQGSANFWLDSQVTLKKIGG